MSPVGKSRNFKIKGVPEKGFKKGSPRLLLAHFLSNKMGVPGVGRPWIRHHPVNVYYEFSIFFSNLNIQQVNQTKIQPNKEEENNYKTDQTV